MTARYEEELDELGTTFERARVAPVDPLRRAALGLARGPAIFVGTGGTAALAQLACDLHITLSGQIGAVATPLEFLQSPPLDRCGAVFFSARAKHPDAQLTIDRLSSGDFSPAVLVTHRDPNELKQVGPDMNAIQIEPPNLKEGFLATNSVLAMGTNLVRAFGHEVKASDLAGLSSYEAPVLADRPVLLVLYPPNLKAAAIDLETRCSELGIASVQLTDLRNVAHGRHTGLARRQAETTVLVLSDEALEALATRVAAVLEQAGISVIRWHAEGSKGVACLRALAASMRAVGQMAAEMGVDPARPKVPEFGRRLYNLPIKRILRRPPDDPVDLKARALAAGHMTQPLTESLQEAFEDWRQCLSKQVFGGLVVDYDGTVCATRERFGVPRPEMQAAIMRIVEAGICLGFATGRGKSLHQGLRSWVPDDYWPRIRLGLYNGAVRLALADELPDLQAPSRLMNEVADRISAGSIGELVDCERRAAQVSLKARDGAFFYDLSLARLARDLLNEEPVIGAKVVSSGHSVDVIAPDTTKVTVLRDLEAQTGRQVLVIGDQGQSGGNDFELLAATRWSISVDRCSADPTRCWNVGRGLRGPAALEKLLARMKISKGTARLAIQA